MNETTGLIAGSVALSDYMHSISETHRRTDTLQRSLPRHVAPTSLAKIAAVMLLTILFLVVQHSIAGAQTPSEVTFPGGWNIVSNAGSSPDNGQIIVGTDGPVYCQSSDLSSYEAISPGSPMRGLACWAYFDVPTTETLQSRSGSPRQLFLPANHWSMVGNPDAVNPAFIGGADYSSIFNPATGDYEPSSILQPGQGGWVYSLIGGWITASGCGNPCTLPQAPTPICVGTNGTVICSGTYNCNGLSIPLSQPCQ